MKYVSFGVFIVIIAIVVGFVTSDWLLVLKISGGVVLVLLFLAGLFTGAMAGGKSLNEINCSYPELSFFYKGLKTSSMLRFLLLRPNKI
ncbi:hypothetical protein J14TS2_24620 [Bacillus sp. J14TS2]|uniref:DUF5316 family protein n=1 Tax=Bacillus sp. J14TS2 TaxID=2807188 RepID=UPI001B24FDCD|nr:DUF5316 family protein [Bacillus sp. J14TS2]GIN71987.1 hypothetical protein J14TS2_24620 [Bacillus sp. J14TS2]